VGSDEGHGRSRSPGAEDWGWSSIGQVLDDQTIKRSDDAVCGLYHPLGDEEQLPWASKPSRLRFVSCTTKPTGDEDGVGHALRSSGRDRVSQSGLKTSVGVARMCMWYHHGGCVELKLKTNGLIR
jgi:hypothetical protein